VLGEMLELGDGAASAHTGVGEHAARVGVDVLVTVGPAADGLAQGFRSAAAAGVAITTAGRDAAADWLRHNVSAADVVLVKASRGAALEVIADDLLTGSANEGSSTP
jgi:UDP-N-acetylmuramoyl-tripeptide--D-alanyl-D-alanine ligase